MRIAPLQCLAVASLWWGSPIFARFFPRTSSNNWPTLDTETLVHLSGKWVMNRVVLRTILHSVLKNTASSNEVSTTAQRKIAFPINLKRSSNFLYASDLSVLGPLSAVVAIIRFHYRALFHFLLTFFLFLPVIRRLTGASYGTGVPAYRTLCKHIQMR